MSQQEAIAAFQRGDKTEARRLILEVLKTEPRNEDAWGILSYVALDQAEQIMALQKVLEINPNSETALRLMQEISAQQPAKPPQPAAPPTVPEVVTQADGTRVRDLGTYEMLWDCQYCDTKKLLGLTHRFCPNCGASQDPKARYFPSDAEKVAVENHVYHGADAICPSCNTPSSAKAEFCGQCGTPLTEAARAKLIADPNLAQKIAPKVQKKWGLLTPTQWVIGGIVTALALLVICIGAVFFVRRDAVVIVVGHTWEREIKIEAFSAVQQEDWDESVPSDAYNESCSQEVRSQKQVPDGETCRTERVDNGDGTFRDREVCETKYRSEPVYDNKCSYTVNRWIYSRSVQAEGNSPADQPYWPDFQLRGGSGLGAEREGGHEEDYVVHLKEVDADKTYECDFSLDKWASFGLESRWTMEVGQILGQADCDTLKPSD